MATLTSTLQTVGTTAGKGARGIQKFASDRAGDGPPKALVAVAGAVGALGVFAFLRRRGGDARRAAKYAGGKVAGAAKSAAPSDREPAEERLNDAALARKVETEIFRDEDVPKGAINVNVEEGVVYLRGEARNPDQIKDLGEAAREVDGVRGVENLLHLPDTPPIAKGQGKSERRARA
jgi:osmotically-inducible protein OsmY